MFNATFVTGATGLLGAELVRQLLDANETRKIVCLVRDYVPTSLFFSEKMHDRVIVVKGDIRDRELMKRIVVEYEIDAIYHLAAQTIVGYANQSPSETLDVNILGTVSLLEAAREFSGQIKAFILASSDKAYGEGTGESFKETNPLQGIHPYDVSKSCADLIGNMYAETYGVRVGVTRCGNIFGPGDLNETRLVPSAILAYLRKEKPIIRSDGRPIRDYIYVSDAAKAYRQLLGRVAQGEFCGEAFNISYGLKLSVLDVVGKIQKKFDAADLGPEVQSQSKHEINIQILDGTKAKELLQWEPDFGFDEGIEKTISWYRDNFKDGEIL